MAVGLRIGSTAILVTRWIAGRVRRGDMHGIVAVTTSYVTFAQALGIPMLADDSSHGTDLTIGGADEVDPAMSLIKDGGGALLRERIVRQALLREAFILDESEPRRRLGACHSLSVAVLTFDWRLQARFLRGLGAVVTPCGQDGRPYCKDCFESHNGPRSLLSVSRITGGNNSKASFSLTAQEAGAVSQPVRASVRPMHRHHPGPEGISASQPAGCRTSLRWGRPRAPAKQAAAVHYK